MPILYAELQTAGLRAGCAQASYSFDQSTDYEGRPNRTVQPGLLKVTLTGEAAAWPVWEAIKLDPFRRQSGHLVFFENEGQTAKRVTFYNAALVHYECRLDARGQDQEAALVTELHFSAALVEVQGQRVMAYSLIPWLTDEATSFRALTPPPPLLPSLALRATAASDKLPSKTPDKAGGPTDWVEQDKWAGKPRSGAGFLGSRKLSRKELTQWTNRLASECGVQLEILQKDSPMLAYMDASQKQGGFQAGAKAIYLRSGPTHYEVIHEAKHAEQFKRLGAERYGQQSRLEKETYVYQELMKDKQNLSSAETEHATGYINRLRKEVGLLPFTS